MSPMLLLENATMHDSIQSRESQLDHDMMVCNEPVHAAVSPWPKQNQLRRQDFTNHNDMTSVVIGTDSAAATFNLHTHLLVTRSPFFAAALQGEFAEGVENKVTLPHERAGTFEWFVLWLYCGSLTGPAVSTCDDAWDCSKGAVRAAVRVGISHSDGELRNKAGMPRYFLLLELYALSDMLMTSSLSNHILDTLARVSEATNTVPTPSDTRLLYDDVLGNPTTSGGGGGGGTHGSLTPLRDMVLDLFVYKKTDKLIDTHLDEWHPRFLRDLIVRLKRAEPDSLARHAVADLVLVTPAARVVCDGACGQVFRPRASKTLDCSLALETRDGTVVFGYAGQALKCERCERVWCARCLADGALGPMIRRRGAQEGIGPCKPWLARTGMGFCERYHRH